MQARALRWRLPRTAPLAPSTPGGDTSTASTLPFRCRCGPVVHARDGVLRQAGPSISRDEAGAEQGVDDEVGTGCRVEPRKAQRSGPVAQRRRRNGSVAGFRASRRPSRRDGRRSQPSIGEVARRDDSHRHHCCPGPHRMATCRGTRPDRSRSSIRKRGLPRPLRPRVPSAGDPLVPSAASRSPRPPRPFRRGNEQFGRKIRAPLRRSPSDRLTVIPEAHP